MADPNVPRGNMRGFVPIPSAPPQEVHQDYMQQFQGNNYSGQSLSAAPAPPREVHQDHMQQFQGNNYSGQSLGAAPAPLWEVYQDSMQQFQVNHYSGQSLSAAPAPPREIRQDHMQQFQGNNYLGQSLSAASAPPWGVHQDYMQPFQGNNYSVQSLSATFDRDHLRFSPRDTMLSSRSMVEQEEDLRKDQNAFRDLVAKDGENKLEIAILQGDSKLSKDTEVRTKAEVVGRLTREKEVEAAWAGQPHGPLLIKELNAERYRATKSQAWITAAWLSKRCDASTVVSMLNREVFNRIMNFVAAMKDGNLRGLKADPWHLNRDWVELRTHYEVKSKQEGLTDEQLHYYGFRIAESGLITIDYTEARSESETARAVRGLAESFEPQPAVGESSLRHLAQES